MNQQSGFSFVIPTLNAQATLERCIEHIRAMDFPQHFIEIIVVDNGSNDATVEIAERLASANYQDTSATISQLRNIGAKNSHYQILVFVDADCLLPKEFANIVSKTFSDRFVGMTGSKTHLLPDTAGWVAQTWKIHLDRSQLSADTTWLVTRALAVRRQAFEQVGGFDETIETCEDVSFGHAIGENWKIVADEKLSPLHLEDADTPFQFLRKEIWRAQNSTQISWQWIKEKPVLLLSKEGVSLILPFYFLGASLLLFLGALSAFATGSLIALFFALLTFLAPVLTLAWDTAKRANRMDAIRKLAALYTLYILAKVIALFFPKKRDTPRRVV